MLHRERDQLILRKQIKRLCACACVTNFPEEPNNRGQRPQLSLQQALGTIYACCYSFFLSYCDPSACLCPRTQEDFGNRQIGRLCSAATRLGERPPQKIDVERMAAKSVNVLTARLGSLDLLKDF